MLTFEHTSFVMLCKRSDLCVVTCAMVEETEGS